MPENRSEFGPFGWFVLALVVVAFLAAFFLSGCSAVEDVGSFIFGTSSDGADLPGPSPAEGVGLLVPGLAALVPVLAGAWAAYLGRRWRALAEATFDVVEESQSVSLKGRMKSLHEKRGVSRYAKALSRKYPHEVRRDS